MFSCIYDPGMALFLAETRDGTDIGPGAVEWTAVAATLVLAMVALAIPA